MLPEVTRHMYTDPVLTEESQLKWYESVSRRDDCIYWTIEVDGAKVGLLSINDIDRRNRRCVWAYYIAAEDMRGKGIGSILEYNIYEYVFENLGLNKLCCEVFRENERVIALHERHGSKVEGILRQHIYKSGEFRDVVLMAITRDEWSSIRESVEFDPIEIE
jgi:UDP-4-amino-4,6-dideoxy-N-acetyl-beta-L-altrosamine N-acetyltransferase